jgi:hypothetical protein
MAITISSSTLNNNSLLKKVEKTESVLVNSPANQYSNDIIEISSQTEALTKALSSVEETLKASKQRGYPFPPPCLTNSKQIDIIKKMIKEKLSTPMDDTIASQAAETLWKKAGYRLDTAPSPDPNTTSGNAFDFLKKTDRQELDKIYDQAEADGLDAMRVTNDASYPICEKRIKEINIANGVSYGESDIIPVSEEEWRQTIESMNKANLEQAQKKISPYELLSSLSTMKKTLRLNDLLLSFLQRTNNSEAGVNEKKGINSH